MRGLEPPLGASGVKTLTGTLLQARVSTPGVAGVRWMGTLGIASLGRGDSGDTGVTPAAGCVGLTDSY